ncbi:hypothetical protein MD484_g1146, partial [Candolleomyces efflorescens]
MSKAERGEELQPEVAEAETGLVYSTFVSAASFLRPYAPQIVPIAVCAFFIPIILAISGFAGYVVWSNLSAKWETPIYLQYGDGIPPNAQLVVPSLHSQQQYDVSLHLVVPASESNLALGNFMASLTLSTANNKTLANVRRPAVAVTPTSWWIFGARNTIDIDVPLLSSFVAGTSSLSADIQLGRRDNWKNLGTGEGRELSVISASLQGIAVPHGIRGLAIRFPLLSSLTAAFIFLTICSLILGICILPTMLPDDTEDDAKALSRRKTSSSLPFPSSEKARRKKRSQHGRRSSEAASPGSESEQIAKAEDSVSAIPPAEEPTPERLRQRKISVKRENEGDS